MSNLYKRIIELDSEAALSLAHNLAVDKTGNASATKITITELYNILIPQIIAGLEASGSIAKAGSIKMFGGAAAPDGWILCDNSSLLRAGTYADLFAEIGVVFGSVDGTHFNVPDFRGIFPRGAGASDKLDDANGSPFDGVLGTYENDAFQGWQTGGDVGGSTKYGYLDGDGNAPDISAAATFAVAYYSTTKQGDVKMIKAQDDGTNGPPRTGTETNPANLGINFIIKY